MREIRFEIGLIAKPIQIGVNFINQNRGRYEPLPGQLDSGLDELPPGQRSVTLMRSPHPGHCSRHGSGSGPNQCRIFDHLALLVEVHIAMRSKGRFFPVIKKRAFTLHVGKHEPATANVAGVNIGHCQRKPCGDSSVHSIATAYQNCFGDCCGVRIRDRDGSLSCLRRRLSGLR